MPELPEVEEVRRTLEPHLLRVPIARIEILRKDFVTPRKAPMNNLIGRTISQTLRHGKKLFLIADDDREGGQTLLVHLGMSGRIDCVPALTPVEKHTHVVVTLTNGMEVRFRDPRRFGGVWYYRTLHEALVQEIVKLGPDALALTPSHLAHWKKTRGRLKHRLLSQRDVAGLGNIYVDEALYLAKLHPMQRVDRLKSSQIDELVKAILQVLKQSLKSGGTTLRDYRNVSNQPGRFARQLKAYGRAGQACGRCATPLVGKVIAARMTTFCPHCQRAL